MPDHNSIHRMRRRLILCAAASALWAMAAMRSSAFARTAYRLQPHDVHDFDWFDDTRGRMVPVRLYRPASAALASEGIGQKLPLLVFSHGLGGSRAGYSYLANFLASRGVACLHPQHIGSDRSIWAAGSPFSLIDRLRSASRDEEAVQRVRDLSFSLDRLSQTQFAIGIDTQRIVVAGHSYGANSALLMGGAQVSRQGRPVILRDPRLNAVIAVSAPPFYGESSLAAILSTMDLPSLHISCTEDLIRIPGLNSGPEDRWAVFEAAGGLPKCLAMFEGGSHGVFTDREATGGFDANRRIKQATCELVFAFLGLVFNRDQSSLLVWKAQHDAILRQFVWR